MKDHDEVGIDRFRGRYSEEELPAGNFAAGEGGERQSLLPATVNVGRLGGFAARALLSLFVSLLLAAVMLAAPIAAPAQVSVGVSVTFGPPALPVYVQPPCPAPDFIWVPGYWAWDPDFGYYWVPGMWVLAPFPGALWTPGYWAWSDGVYIWYEGYWGPVVGYYGGINYGYGYTGYGYQGGYWSGNRFYYNRSVNNISGRNITTVYSRPVRNVRPSGASFHGGRGGTTIRPTAEQQAAARERRSSLIGPQQQQLRSARTDPKQRATVNRGRPAIAATTRPGVFRGQGVTGASRAGAPYKAPPGRRAAPHERVLTPKPGEMRPPGTAPERVTPGTPRRAPERMAPGTPRRVPERMAPGTSRRAPERMAPGTPRRAPEQRLNEPRPAQQRPETRKPAQPKKETREEREEQR
jgi:hypothetical protein